MGLITTPTDHNQPTLQFGQQEFIMVQGSVVMSTAVPLVETMIKRAAEVTLQWPTAVDSLDTFANKIVQVTRNIRTSEPGSCGFIGGRTAEGGYLVKSFVRCFLAVLAETDPGGSESVFRTSTVEHIQRWTPDINRHLDAVKHWTASKVLATFGVHIVWLSCWACLAASLSPDAAKFIIETSSDELLAIVQGLEKHGQTPTRDFSIT
jgi:hypothetical protein